MSASSSVSERPYQPLYPTRLANLLGRFRKPMVLDPEDMIRRAETATGLSNWGDDPFREGLEQFSRAVNEDGTMHHAGRLMTRMGIDKWLQDRLRIQQVLEDEPEITRRPVERPILIPGWPRAGTTLLHRLLAVDPRFRTPRSWEIYFPVPPPDPKTYEEDPRIAETSSFYKLVFKTSPALAVAHPMEAEWPEECWYLLDRSFIRVLPGVYFDVPGYREWLLSRSREELEPAYRYHKKQIQILQWRFPQVQWLLKSPIHGVLLGAFHAVYPDARYIFCHRDPVKTVPSACSLVAARRAAFYSTLDLNEIGATVLAFVAEGTRRGLEARRLMEPEQFLDVSFSELVTDPLGKAREIYEWLGEDLPPEAEAEMRRFLEAQKSGRHVGHRYGLEQFGLDPKTVERTFEFYRDEVGEYLRVGKVPFSLW